MSKSDALYQVRNNELIPASASIEHTDILELVSSTQESRHICNDPLLIGIQYTHALKEACKKTILQMKKASLLHLREDHTVVLHLLRGGLNFGLREALAEASSWNKHSSSFLSAQRERMEDNPENWRITETSYQKVYLKPELDLIFGDVVATGTSLRYALEYIERKIEEYAITPGHFYFFTIGGDESRKKVEEFKKNLASKGRSFRSYTIVYLEGIFAVALPETPLQIKYTGTDLIRSNCLMAPEFITSQSESPSYPIERCTIYDAGSRAFDIATYLTDVKHYWSLVHSLAEKGVSYQSYLEERMPGATLPSSFDLLALSKKRLELIPNSFDSYGAVGEG